MVKHLLLLLALCLPVFAQDGKPDCGPVAINFNATGQATTPIDNRQSGCIFWVVQYENVGFSALTVTFQQATGNVTAGAFGTYTGTVVSGAVAATNTTGLVSTFANGTVNSQWLRVTLTGTMGTGTVTGTLYGYKTGTPGSSSGPPSAGCPNPCPVDGPTAAGSPPTTPPVLQAGIDGTNIRTVRTDTNGREEPAFVAATLADGATNTPQIPAAGAAQMNNVERPYAFNSATWDRQFFCTLQTPFTLSAATDVVIAAGVSSTTIKLCHIDFANDSSQTVLIRQGTGVTCGSNTASLAGTYAAAIAFAMDYQPTAALHSTVAARDVCLHFGAAVTGGGVAIYAQY